MRSMLRGVVVLAVAVTAAAVAASACGDDAGHRAKNDAANGNGNGDGGNGDGGNDNGDGGNHDASLDALAPALGCDPAVIAVDCPASLAVTTMNMPEGAFTATYMTDPTAPSTNT
jgi:hypothetical protein